MIIDITDRKRAERSQKQLTLRLEQQANQLQMVMDSVPEGVFVIDSNGIILLTNPTAGKDLIALTGGGVGDSLQTLGENSLDELLAPPPEGLWHQIAWQNRNFELIAKPLKGSEAETGWVVVIRDVTTEKEVENASNNKIGSLQWVNWRQVLLMISIILWALSPCIRI